MISDELASAIITALSLVIVALIGAGFPLLRSAQKNAKQANEQVSNSHKTNFRDEQDERHEQNQSRIGALEDLANATARGVVRIEDHLGIEHTAQPTRTRKRNPQ